MSAPRSPDADEEALNPPRSSGQDSAYGQSVRTSTTSLASCYLHPREENGRLYNPVHDYPFPCDELEKEHLDYQHKVFWKHLIQNLSWLQSPAVHTMSWTLAPELASGH